MVYFGIPSTFQSKRLRCSYVISQVPADLLTFTEEIINGKLQFLYFQMNDTAIKQLILTKKKTIYFILQNMFRSLHTSSSVVHIKSTVNVQIIKGLLQCYSIVKNTFKNFYLTIFIAIKTNLMNKTIKTLYIKY